MVVSQSVLMSVRQCSWRWLATVAAISSLFAEGARAERDFDHIDWQKERTFWAFTAPKTPALPEVKNQRWPRQDLDYFVLAKLEERRLSPAFEADKRTMLRRAAYDLTGLPPSLEVADWFLKDTRPDAYERLVDELIAMPSFGERMASMW